MGFPACTGLGEATFVTDKFGPEVPTIVVTVAVLFEAVGLRIPRVAASPAVCLQRQTAFATVCRQHHDGSTGSSLIPRRQRSYDPGIAVSASYVSRVRP